MKRTAQTLRHIHACKQRVNAQLMGWQFVSRATYIRECLPLSRARHAARRQRARSSRLPLAVIISTLIMSTVAATAFVCTSTVTGMLFRKAFADLHNRRLRTTGRRATASTDGMKVDWSPVLIVAASATGSVSALISAACWVRVGCSI